MISMQAVIRLRADCVSQSPILLNFLFLKSKAISGGHRFDVGTTQ